MTNNRHFVPRDPASLEALVDDVVTRMFWMVAQPSSANSNMGFQLRKGLLKRELRLYGTLYEAWAGKLPSLEHLFAAGSYIYQETTSGRTKYSFQFNEPLFTSKEKFEEIWSVAAYRMEQLPGADLDGHDPYARPGRVPAAGGSSVAVVTDWPNAKNQTVYLGERACRQLEDLTWYFGSASSVFDRAISVFWAHTAIRKGRTYNPDYPWPTSADEAWDRIYAETAGDEGYGWGLPQGEDQSDEARDVWGWMKEADDDDAN